MSEIQKNVSIEDINLFDSKFVLSSPRSLKACRQLGIIPSELQYISLDQYKLLHPDFQILPSEIVQYRYDHYEKFRLDTINLVKLQREKIVNQSSSQSNSTAKTADYAFQSSFDGMYDFIVDNEKRQLDKIKFRQKFEIQSIIENEVKMEAMRSQSKEKEKKQKEKELWEQYQKMIEDRKRDIELKRHLEYDQHLEDKKRRTEERFYSTELKQRQRGVLYRKPIDNYMDLRVIKAEARRCIQDQRERGRKDQIEKEKMEKMQSYERQKIDYDMRLSRTRTANDLNLLKIQREIKAKHTLNEKKREEFISLREISIKKRQEIEAAKFKNIILSIRKAEEEEEKKVQMYFEKKYKMDQVVHIKETSKKKDIQKRSQSLNNLFIKTSEARFEREKEDEKKKCEICYKIDSIHKRYINDSKEKEKEHTYKREDAYTKRFEKYQLIIRKNRAKDYQCEDMGIELIEKEKKIEDYKLQKMKMIKRKIKMTQSISNEKKDLIERYENVLYKTKNLDLRTIQKLFPDDKEFLMKIREIKGHKSTETNKKGTTKSSQSSTTNNNKESKDQHVTLEHILEIDNQEEYEKEKQRVIQEENAKERKMIEERERNRKAKEIEKKVEEYHSQLLQELNKVIEKEKQNEINRINLFEKEDSLEEKQKLENVMSKERAEANKKIKDMQRYNYFIIYIYNVNSQIELKLKEYELQLNEEYNNQI